IMVEEKERKSVIGAGFRVGHLIVAGATYEGTSVTFLESRRKKPSKSNTSRYTGVYQNKRIMGGPDHLQGKDVLSGIAYEA
ncbi:MAG: hypothetical protein J6N32_03010, partial [Clostridia bacterium]|nr:hypothetical protein [Clostridia bacterium]